MKLSIYGYSSNRSPPILHQGLPSQGLQGNIQRRGFDTLVSLKGGLGQGEGWRLQVHLAGRLHRIGQGAGLRSGEKAESVLAEHLEEATLRPDSGHLHCREARKRNSPQAPAFGMGKQRRLDLEFRPNPRRLGVLPYEPEIGRRTRV